ncbi:MAG: hypothetical protein ACLPN1_19260 [Dissulfurispiraceae bacterium]
MMNLMCLILSPKVIEFVDEVKARGKTMRKISINGIQWWLFGSRVQPEESEPRGIILVFIRGDRL